LSFYLCKKSVPADRRFVSYLSDSHPSRHSIRAITNSEWYALTVPRVLIADDDPVYRKLVATALVRHGCEIVSSSDGDTARKTLENGGIDVCILDWEMPGMSGPELCCWMRSAGVKPLPYIILLTSRDDPEQIAQALRAGADDYFCKPVDTEELASKVTLLAQAMNRKRCSNDWN
jgi:DNA-binding response OmpR family regulator